ncbi:hypothetical protein AeMF1_005526 [Aphanomyces euteiches]|nr:hypothetical protein AeMF1_005526 [Aphanomyces euteiches]KAH9185727.1 hypothetical protein AeNC1_012296 [Aphanomyces euteiches]
MESGRPKVAKIQEQDGMNHEIYKAWHAIVQSEDVFTTIVSFQDGYIEEFIPFLRLAKPVFRTPCDEWFTVWAEESQRVLSPWFESYNLSRLAILFGLFPHLRDIVVIEAVISGRLDVLEYLHSTINLHSVHERLLDIAACYGQLHSLQFLHNINHLGCSKQAIDEAATNGHLKVIEWLFDNREDGFTINAWNGAIKNGHIAILDCLHTNQHMECPLGWRLFKEFQFVSNEIAPSILQWFQKNRPQDYKNSNGALIESVITNNLDAIDVKSLDSETICFLFRTAIVYGHLDLARRVEHFQPEEMIKVCRKAVPLAGRNGRLDIVQWWTSKAEGYTECEIVLLEALKAAQWHVSDWLLTHLPQSCLERFCTLFRLIPFSKYGCLSPIFQRVVLEDLPLKSPLVAARVGNLSALKPHKESISTDIVSQAIFGGHLRVIKKFHEWSIRSASLQAATWTGHLNVVKFVADNWELSSPFFSPHRDISILHTEVVLYLLSAGQMVNTFLFSRAARDEQFDLFYRLNTDSTGHFQCDSHVWLAICAYGNLQFGQFLVTNNLIRPNVIYTPTVTASISILRFLLDASPPTHADSLIVDAASYGFLPSLRLLLEQYPNAYTPRAMDIAAGQGHLEVVKYLHESQSQGCTTNAMDDAASNGHIDIIKWLNGNRHEGCTEEALEGAARNDHLDVVKYLVNELCLSPKSIETREWIGPKVRAYLARLRFYGNAKAVEKSQVIAANRGCSAAQQLGIEEEVIVSISAMVWYSNVSVEELRWENYSTTNLPKNANTAKEFPAYKETYPNHHPFQPRQNVLQAIGSMKSYEGQSAEEIRWEDYTIRAAITHTNGGVSNTTMDDVEQRISLNQ